MGVADEEEQKQMEGPGSNEEKIFVSVRLRPLNEKEVARNDVVDWECINDTTIIHRNNLSVSERSMYPSAYTFDRVFRSDSPTRQVYEEAAKEVALSVVSGINASVFAYGQTSSGKTFTMSGITEYTMADIFDYVEKHKEREFSMKFSAMEIYNESVRDLLTADSSPLRLLDDPERGTVVEKLTEETLRNWNHFEELLSVCEAQRQIGETALNEASSRSHQILRLAIESSAREFSGRDKSSILTATVNFVDLAGSERASHSLSAGTRLKEGCHINRSLLTLGTVIRKLSKGKNGHVPYRDSKLTRILQSSLGGNARTAIICTMSPARTHVEQSRNTLLFASCAKEVTTNAQVNVVMSDKVLVKHLQKELARLESELKSPKSTSMEFESSALLQEKDLEIEKLRREVAELTTERDLARSQVEDLLQVVGVRPSLEVIDDQYPKLRVQRNSWDFESPMVESPDMEDLQYPSVGIRSFETSEASESHSRSSSNENLPQLRDFRENFLLTTSSAQLPVGVHDVGTDVDQEETEEQIEDTDQEEAEEQMEQVDQEETEEQIDETFEDHCKEVQCIEIKKQRNLSESSPTRHSNVSSPEINTATSGLKVVENEDGSKLQFASTPLKAQKQLKAIDTDFVIPSPEKSSPPLLREDISSLKLFRSRSCKARLMTRSSPHWLDKRVDNESTPPVEFEKDFSGRPKGVQRKVSALKFDVDVERLSRNGSQTSSGDAGIDELEAKNDDISNDKISDSISSLDAIKGKKPDLRSEEQLTDSKEAEPKRTASVKSVKNVGLDPIDIHSESPLDWHVEFKRLQREIIELWHACNVSLVHRTYFFHLFKGDPKDTIYMEVEHKRLSFLKDALLRGNQTAESGQPLTSATSMRALQHERHMLSHLMRKRLSKEERENLFLRWGIGLNKKNRRLKLVQRLWTNAQDMDHITESAAVVSKLVGFIEPEQNFQEVFGFNFTPQRKTKKFRRWIRSVMSLV